MERSLSWKKFIHLCVSATRVFKQLIHLCVSATRVCKKLILDFGYGKAVFRGESVDRNENAIPWFTYPCVEYLKQLDLRDKSVFEWGSGNSTLFLANRCKDVTSVENNTDYFQKNKARLKNNAKLLLKTKLDEYVHAIAECNKAFDIIIIDGQERFACAQLAIKYVSHDGIVILDNSSQYYKTAGFLRDQDLIQVDFSGFGPLCDYTWVTSLFFQRTAKLRSLDENQPAWPPGASRIEMQHPEA